MKVEKKVAIVTGASRGIGKAIALKLAERRCNVVVNYFKNKEKALDVVKLVKKCGAEGLAVKADVSKFNEVKEMVEKTIEKFGRIDILVNNAGVISKKYSIAEIDEEEWDRILNVNLKGTFNCCKAVVPHMIEQRVGKIVNISSIAGRMGGMVGVHYAASKAGVLGLTYALASELAEYNITVNAVAPNAVDTEMISEELKEKIAKLTPLKRIAKPEEVAHAVLFLIENDYITAEVIDVNGGRYPG